ncbi:MAG: hypothetical protein M1831_001822 [Alyxoria varia]|nr:MAG: hypothetical protein M1831_001822 [Alyxoria varia]
MTPPVPQPVQRIRRTYRNKGTLSLYYSSSQAYQKYPKRTSAGSSLGPPASPYPQHIDPSPVDSNGTASTDTTDIDDAPQEMAQDANQEADISSPKSGGITSPMSPGALARLDTNIPDEDRTNADTGPQSVIHAPLKTFDSPNSITKNSIPEQSPSDRSQRSENTIVSPQTPEARPPTEPNRGSISSPSGPPLKTDVPNSHSVDRSTPRAQTVQEAELEWLNRRMTVGLEDIPEGQDGDRNAEDEASQVDVAEARRVAEREKNTEALRAALSECWTLCNTLAGLSSNHRFRVFAFRGRSVVQEQAWRSCWRLCQSLYESRDDDPSGHVLSTLEMCRDFCQALFEARQKSDEVTDSVLRVSFELNNHLYNTHDRNLPSAFQERTLDFYLTLCHRLMKQQTSLPRETDSLLRACWTLAELLFSIRQNKREGKPADEELLSSAVQACWDLGDLFREGWSQIRPDRERTTPRPDKGGFIQASTHSSSYRSQSSLSARSSPSLSRSHASRYDLYRDPKTFPPETPTTIFDDNEPLDTDDGTGNLPNIMVLGPDNTSNSQLYRHQHKRWSSSASTISGLSESSHHTSSTATASSSLLEAHLNRIRVLLLKAATNAGFQLRTTTHSPTLSPSGSSSSQHSSSISLSPATQTLRLQRQQNGALIAFVKAIPRDGFGNAPAHVTLLDSYRHLVVAWPKLVKNAGVVIASPSSDEATSAAASATAGSNANSSSHGNGKDNAATGTGCDHLSGLQLIVACAIPGPSTTAASNTASTSPPPVANNGSAPASGAASSSSATSSTQQQGPHGPSPPPAQQQSQQSQSQTPLQHHPKRQPTPAEVARAVQWMMRSERNLWLGGLYRWVFGCGPDDSIVGRLRGTITF